MTTELKCPLWQNNLFGLSFYNSRPRPLVHHKPQLGPQSRQAFKPQSEKHLCLAQRAGSVQTVDSAGWATEQKYLLLLFWSGLDCITHWVKYLSRRQSGSTVQETDGKYRPSGLFYLLHSVTPLWHTFSLSTRAHCHHTLFISAWLWLFGVGSLHGPLCCVFVRTQTSTHNSPGLSATGLKSWHFKPVNG